MLLLAAILGLGWPKERTLWISAGEVPAGLTAMRANRCCGSMAPILKGGELIYVEPYHGQPLVGFIVVTDKVTHRVVAENERAVYTAGDANKYSDGWSPKSEVRFVVKYVVRP